MRNIICVKSVSLIIVGLLTRFNYFYKLLQVCRVSEKTYTFSHNIQF